LEASRSLTGRLRKIIRIAARLSSSGWM